MADYTIDWDSANLDSSNDYTSINDAGDTVHVDISTPPNSSGQQWGLLGQVGQGTLESDFPTIGTSTEVFVNFNENVADTTFRLHDIDGASPSQNLSWDDKVTIEAIDALGNPVATIYTDKDGQIVTGNTIEGNGDFDVTSFVTVSFDGPIAAFHVTFTNGPDDTSAGYVGISDVTFNEFAPGCFVRGTLIKTNRGEVAVEDLLAGDLVRTLDHGMQAMRWIGSTKVKGKGSKAPILFRKGSIGNSADLLLSPEHRVMVQGWKAEVLFGKSELLASAKALVNDDTITRQDAEQVEYFHILFDAHEIVFSNGAATESFHPGEASIGSMAVETRAEILELFPELAGNSKSYGPSVRNTLNAHEVALLSV